MDKKAARIILFLIIVSQVACVAYWASLKSRFHIDEFYTFEYAQLFRPDKRIKQQEDLTDIPQWEDGRWLSVGELRTNLTVQEGESVLDLPLGKSVKMFLLDRNYMWIINFLETIAGEKDLPVRICIGFNIFVLILSQLLLFHFLSVCLGLDARTALLSVAMWGFSPLVLGLSVFCRFYLWTLFLFLVALVSHRMMWDSDSHWRNILYEAIGATALLLAFNNSELFFVIGGALAVFFSVSLLVRKKYVQSLYYSVPVLVGGLLYIIRRTDFLLAVFRPGYYAGLQDSGEIGNHLNYLFNTTVGDKAAALYSVIDKFAHTFFGSGIAALAAFLGVLALLWFVRRKKPGVIDGFSLILIGVAFSYWIFCGVTGMMYTRYHSFLFLLVVIILWGVFDRLANSCGHPRMAYTAALVFVLVGAALPFKKMNVPYVYEDWERFGEQVSGYAGLDAVVDYNPYYQITVYDCVSRLGESSHIYPRPLYHPYTGLKDLPDTFLYWTTVDPSPRETLESIKARGYSLELLTEEAKEELVFVCVKTGGGASQGGTLPATPRASH
ncbi:MAG: hypothetical protein IJ840_05600 [Bacteroidales bacterium]|nr:hypothetical protein [Bacteroidales bacterium]